MVWSGRSSWIQWPQSCRWYLYEDGARILAAGGGAVEWFRAHGYDHAADLVEMESIGSGLMTTGRFDDAVAQFEAWVDRYAACGPPTFHYNSLGFIGFTLQLRGDVEEARECFLAAADIGVPPGT